jgi:hypothetical protein
LREKHAEGLLLQQPGRLLSGTRNASLGRCFSLLSIGANFGKNTSIVAGEIDAGFRDIEQEITGIPVRVLLRCPSL